jgi:hypothetical protein
MLTGTMVFSSGCSLSIARSGKDLDTLTTKDQVHEQFGHPSASGIAKGRPWDVYCIRRKIAEPLAVKLGHELTLVFTLGIAEIGYFPYELFHLGWTTIIGRDVGFVYDNAGKVTKIFLDGEPTDAEIVAP